jgi:uncharacterized protein with von Willebrand factor type A (vWA) domain
MIGWRFSEFDGYDGFKSNFDKLLGLFQELLIYTSGDVKEAMSWLTELDNTYEVTGDDYGIADFMDEMMERGFIKFDEQTGDMEMSVKLEVSLRNFALEDVFNTIKKSKAGKHSSKVLGKGDEFTSELRPFEFGDKSENIAFAESIRNAQINHGIDQFKLTPEDIEVRETFYQSQMSSVLMIDISHSMILYGEDRISPAKKVAMALAQYITTRFPKDTLDIIVFGNDAWPVKLEDLPFLNVGPYHTNTVAGLELANKILQKKKNNNKQVFLITDGKPSCIKKGNSYYKNSFGLDRQIVNRTLAQARRFRKMGIPITTFMIARDPFLIEFVEKFTRENQGKAFFSSLDNLGAFVIRDYNDAKKRK